MARVFYTTLPANLRLTMLALADFADDEGGSLFVGQRHLALRCGSTDRTVRRHLSSLVAEGFLVEEVRLGQHGTNRYQIVLDALPTDVDIRAMKARTLDARPDKLSGRDIVDRTPVSALDRTPVTALDRTPVSYKPSVEPSAEPSALRLADKRKPDLLFEALYGILFGKVYADGGGLTSSARGSLNAALKELHEAGATEAQVLGVPSAWMLLFPGSSPPTLTPGAVAKHWPALMAIEERGYVARGSGTAGQALGAALDAEEEAAMRGATA